MWKNWVQHANTVRKIDDHQQKQMRMCEGYLHVLMTLGKYEYIDYSLEI